MKNLSFILIALFMGSALIAQDMDNGIVKEHSSNDFMRAMLQDIRAFDKQKKKEEKHYEFVLDMSGMDLPTDISQYTTVWHNPTLSQGYAGSCWSFSTLSFLETELKRLNDIEVKLSEQFIIYWEYVEKARGYVQSRGETPFEQGSQGNAVNRIGKMYGLVPASAYSGKLPGQTHDNHFKMKEEMDTYLASVERDQAWNEEQVLATIRSILDSYMGTPPESFAYEGKTYTPVNFRDAYLKIKLDDFVSFYSMKQEPFWQQVEYDVRDNWWDCDEYHNVPADVFISIMKEAIKEGYSFSIGGDVSESGFVREYQVAVVPTYDIPSEYIDDNARQLRFSNGATTDDHGMHVVGYLEQDGLTWFLVKDSSSGSRYADEEDGIFGYYIFHEDYMKLKMTVFGIHRDAVEDVLKKFD